MSSIRRSRGPPNPGTEPTEELGYPALVQYTFVPNDSESSELLVSEGDIVQLVYRVGGWVFVRTYEGKVGYIPFSFCKELECSKEVGSTYSETDVKVGTLSITQNSKTEKSEKFKYQRYSADSISKQSIEQQAVGTKPGKRVHFADQPKSKNFCDICCNFLTSFTSIDHYTNAGQKKANLKPHKLLKLLQTISKESTVNTGNTKPTHNVQSGFGQITDNRINRRVNKSEFPIKFGNFCNQCDVLKDIFKQTNRYSMSDLYSTIRNLHLDALTDSDSDQEDISEGDVRNENQNGRLQSDQNNKSSSEKMPKRSISFKEPDVKQKIDIIRNNSFSGITDVERKELVNGTVSPVESANKYISCGNVYGSDAKSPNVKNVNGTNKGVEFRNQKLNNYFTENQPPFSNGYDEAVTDFRSAEYQPPLINKWRPANGSIPVETNPKPLGIVREETFVYDSMKSRQKEVNFNDPKKENLNLTNGEDRKHHSPKVHSQMRHFSMDVRRKPIISNGDFSLDDFDNFRSSENPPSNRKSITQCFTTYGQSTKFHEDVTGKNEPSPSSHENIVCSGTHQTQYQQSSQYSNGENSDNGAREQNIENGHQEYCCHYQKQTSDSGTDKRKVVARKINPVTSPRNLMSTSGPLIGRKNDKDIRKSLLEHSVMKKTMASQSEKISTQPMRAQPMRAQHDIANPQDAASASGRTVLVKKFNKQMWRPSLAGTEGSDQRPFSPFGGTLPPSKIVKKKVVEVFV